MVNIEIEIKENKIDFDNLSDADFDSILSPLDENLKKALEKESKKEVKDEELLKSANSLIKIYNKNSVLIRQCENNILKIKNKESINPEYSESELKKQKIEQEALKLQYYKQMFSEAFIFDDKLSSFLYGKNNFPKKAIFVFEDSSHTLFSYEMSTEKLLEKVNKEERIKVGVSKKSLDPTGDMSIEVRKSKENQDWEKRVHMARTAYKAAYNRLDAYYEAKEEAYEQGKLGEIKYNEKTGKIKKLQRQAGILLWKKHKEWEHIQITNAGDLKEGYTSMIFDNHLKILENLGKPKYYSHQLIDTYVSYIQNVTNMAAILQEDLVTGNAQYAIKTLKAELPSFNQYLFAANVIINDFGKNQFYKKRIAAEIANEYNMDASRNIKKELSESVKDIVQKTIKIIGE